ncbi:sugar phosphate isomerase/epimerase [Patescibacteria group bacterium]|nr:sugar phosphate isomerase/epimerase [Patescibacteria group bacterium]
MQKLVTKELKYGGGRPHAYRDDLTEAELKDIRSLIEGKGLEVSAFIPAQFRYPTSLVNPKKKIREDSINYIKESFDTAIALGTYKVTVCPGHTLYDQSLESAWQLLKESLEALLEHAQKYDITLLLEPAHRMESDLIITVDDALKMIKEIKSNKIGIVLDTGHVAVNKESLKDCVRKLNESKSIFHIHIDDNNGLMDEHLIPGRGEINFIPFLKELRKIEYKEFLTVELGFQYTINPDSAVYESREFILSQMKRTKRVQDSLEEK